VQVFFRRALILGCGYTGLALARRLLASGSSVEATSLGGADPGLPGLRVRALDLTAPPRDLSFGEAAEGAAVYYLVSTLHRVYDPVARPHLAPLEAVLAALGRAPAALVYLSSTSVYGDRDGELVDEATPVTPGSPWGWMRAELERRVWTWGCERGVPACVLRVPEIYGPGRGPIARLRAGGVLRYPERFSNRIHLDDLVEVLVALGARREPELLLACDDEPARSGEVYALAARLLGLDRVPVGGEGDGDANLLSLQRDSKRCSNARLRAWLGHPLRYPSYREGLPATL
jgi:nucleoside-diphosphate-sugar epimerase